MARPGKALIINRYPAMLRNRGQASARIGQAMRNLAQSSTNKTRIKVASVTPRSLGNLAASTRNKVVFDLATDSYMGVVYQDAKRGGYHYASAIPSRGSSRHSNTLQGAHPMGTT